MEKMSQNTWVMTPSKEIEMKKYVKLIPFIIFVLLAVGCELTQDNKGTLILDMSLEQTIDTAAGISSDSITYKVTGKGPDGAVFTMNTTQKIIIIKDLVAGEWDIIVQALNDEVSIIGEGRGSVVIIPKVKTRLVIVIIFVYPTPEPTPEPSVEPTPEPTAVPTTEPHIICDRGTITYIPLEGGFFGIIGDHGDRYDPINLPPEMRKKCLHVEFTAIVRNNMGSIHMWGIIVEIIHIEVIELIPCFTLIWTEYPDNIPILAENDILPISHKVRLHPCEGTIIKAIDPRIWIDPLDSVYFPPIFSHWEVVKGDPWSFRIVDPDSPVTEVIALACGYAEVVPVYDFPIYVTEQQVLED
jgi:hypothetical protein